MRTTVTLSDDVAAEVERLRHERGIGLSAAVNELARAGMARRPVARPFRQRSMPLGLRIDVSNVAEVLEILDSDDR
ncbi:MAG: ribbon-helix-helix protein, CopG family [Micrococcales bacterium]|nr:ribbon-helix-helix protein, CopG family [Micrococcales bacterium]